MSHQRARDSSMNPDHPTSRRVNAIVAVRTLVNFHHVTASSKPPEHATTPGRPHTAKAI